MPETILNDRGVVRVSGEDARGFLQGLVTCDMDAVSPERAEFGALLTPQGKIIGDFFVYEREGGFLLDAPLGFAAELAKKLGFYKLRAKVSVQNISETSSVHVSWGEAASGWVDPCLAALGQRDVVAKSEADAALRAAYEVLRISLGVPQGGADFVYGDTFPHEANMDVLHGVDFQKGCYVGQEVVSRMQHKTQVRKRVVPVSFEGASLTCGAEVKAGEIVIGRMGSSIAGRGLALLRLDKVDDALAASVDLLVEGRKITVLPLPYAPLKS